MGVGQFPATKRITMTVEELRAKIEEGKRAAKARIDREFGKGTFAKIEAYSKSDANRKALESLCRHVRD